MMNPAETGLNFAQARHQSATQGRFTSPDPFGGSATIADPQSFNRYSYVGNNPMGRSDPSGLDWTTDASRQGCSDRFYQSMGGITDLFNSNVEHINAFDWSPAVDYIIPQRDAQDEVVSIVITGLEEAADPDPQHSQGTILIIVGNPGLNETINGRLYQHNAGDAFDRIAATKKTALEADGYDVIIRRASSFDDFNRELTSNGILRGVEYIGHSSNIKLFVGEQHTAGSNVDHSNYSKLSFVRLGSNAYIKLNGCNVGAGGHNSIAQWLSNWSGKSVAAFSGPTHFEGPGGAPVTRGRPVYLVEDNGTKMVIFTPY